MEMSTTESRSRIPGVLMAGVGIAMAGFFFNAYRNNQPFQEDLLLFLPFCLFYGIAGIFEPGIMAGGASFLEGRSRKISLILIPVSIAAGFFLRYVIFKDWS